MGTNNMIILDTTNMYYVLVAEIELCTGASLCAIQHSQHRIDDVTVVTAL